MGTLKYDGLGRRNVKKIENSGDWNGTYRYTCDGQKVAETRDASDTLLKQYLWGTQYIDELVQIGTNPSTGSGP